MNELLKKLQFDKISMEYLVAVIFLGAALIVGTCKGIENLAGQIAAGMVGYIGGRMSANADKAKAERFSPPPSNPDNDKKEIFADSVKQGAE